MKKVIVEDLYSSYLTFTVKDFVNYGRFQIESICRVNNSKDEMEYYLLSPVMACNVYGNGQLIKDPPYMFQAIFSKTHYKIFRTYLPSMKPDDSSGLIEDNFEGIELGIKRKKMTLLEDTEQVIQAVKDNKRMQGRIIINDIIGGKALNLSVVFPVKHINILPEANQFQVETGAIALPFLSTRPDYEIDRFCVCYIAFNDTKKIDILQLPGMEALSKKYLANIYKHN